MPSLLLLLLEWPENLRRFLTRATRTLLPRLFCYSRPNYGNKHGLYFSQIPSIFISETLHPDSSPVIQSSYASTWQLIPNTRPFGSQWNLFFVACNCTSYSFKAAVKPKKKQATIYTETRLCILRRPKRLYRGQNASLLPKNAAFRTQKSEGQKISSTTRASQPAVSPEIPFKSVPPWRS